MHKSSREQPGWPTLRGFQRGRGGPGPCDEGLETSGIQEKHLLTPRAAGRVSHRQAF